jgi:hypothetical protein
MNVIIGELSPFFFATVLVGRIFLVSDEPEEAAGILSRAEILATPRTSLTPSMWWR